jgi:UDP-glucuronate decarboxylase
LWHMPLPQDDPKRRKPSIERASSLLGWSPRVALDDGLRATIGYFALKLFSTENERGEPVIAKLARRKPSVRDVGQSAPA